MKRLEIQYFELQYSSQELTGNSFQVNFQYEDSTESPAKTCATTWKPGEDDWSVLWEEKISMPIPSAASNSIRCEIVTVSTLGNKIALQGVIDISSINISSWSSISVALKGSAGETTNCTLEFFWQVVEDTTVPPPPPPPPPRPLESSASLVEQTFSSPSQSDKQSRISSFIQEKRISISNIDDDDNTSDTSDDHPTTVMSPSTGIRDSVSASIAVNRINLNTFTSDSSDGDTASEESVHHFDESELNEPCSNPESNETVESKQLITNQSSELQTAEFSRETIDTAVDPAIETALTQDTKATSIPLIDSDLMETSSIYEKGDSLSFTNPMMTKKGFVEEKKLVPTVSPLHDKIIRSDGYVNPLRAKFSASKQRAKTSLSSSSQQAVVEDNKNSSDASIINELSLEESAGASIELHKVVDEKSASPLECQTSSSDFQVPEEQIKDSIISYLDVNNTMSDNKLPEESPAESIPDDVHQSEHEDMMTPVSTQTQMLIYSETIESSIIAVQGSSPVTAESEEPESEEPVAVEYPANKSILNTSADKEDEDHQREGDDQKAGDPQKEGEQFNQTSKEGIEMEELRFHYKQLKSENQELKSTLQRQIESAKSIETRLEQKVKEVQDQLSTLSMQHNALISNVSSYQAVIKMKETEVHETKDALAHKDKELQRLKESVKGLEHQIEELKTKPPTNKIQDKKATDSILSNQRSSSDSLPKESLEKRPAPIEKSKSLPMEGGHESIIQSPSAKSSSEQKATKEDIVHPYPLDRSTSDPLNNNSRKNDVREKVNRVLYRQSILQLPMPTPERSNSRLKEREAESIMISSTPYIKVNSRGEQTSSSPPSPFYQAVPFSGDKDQGRTVVAPSQSSISSFESQFEPVISDIPQFSSMSVERIGVSSSSQEDPKFVKKSSSSNLFNVFPSVELSSIPDNMEYSSSAFSLVSKGAPEALSSSTALQSQGDAAASASSSGQAPVTRPAKRLSASDRKLSGRNLLAAAGLDKNENVIEVVNKLTSDIKRSMSFYQLHSEESLEMKQSREGNSIVPFSAGNNNMSKRDMEDARGIPALEDVPGFSSAPKIASSSIGKHYFEEVKASNQSQSAKETNHAISLSSADDSKGKFKAIEQKQAECDKPMNMKHYYSRLLDLVGEGIRPGVLRIFRLVDLSITNSSAGKVSPQVESRSPDLASMAQRRRSVAADKSFAASTRPPTTSLSPHSNTRKRSMIVDLNPSSPVSGAQQGDPLINEPIAPRSESRQQQSSNILPSLDSYDTRALLDIIAQSHQNQASSEMKAKVQVILCQMLQLENIEDLLSHVRLLQEASYKVESDASELISGKLWDISSLFHAAKVLIYIFGSDAMTGKPHAISEFTHIAERSMNADAIHINNSIRVMKEELQRLLVKQTSENSAIAPESYSKKGVINPISSNRLNNIFKTRSQSILMINARVHAPDVAPTEPVTASAPVPVPVLAPAPHSAVLAPGLLTDSEALRAQIAISILPNNLATLELMHKLTAYKECMTAHAAHLKSMGKRDSYKFLKKFAAAIEEQLNIDLTGQGSPQQVSSPLNLKIRRTVDELDQILMSSPNGTGTGTDSLSTEGIKVLGKNLMDRLRGLSAQSDELFHRMLMYREAIGALAPSLSDIDSDDDDNDSDSERDDRRPRRKSKHAKNKNIPRTQEDIDQENIERAMEELLQTKEELKKKISSTAFECVDELSQCLKSSAAAALETLALKLFETSFRKDDNSIAVLLLRSKSFVILKSIFSSWPGLSLQVPHLEETLSAASVSAASPAPHNLYSPNSSFRINLTKNFHSPTPSKGANTRFNHPAGSPSADLASSSADLLSPFKANASKAKPLEVYKDCAAKSIDISKINFSDTKSLRSVGFRLLQLFDCKLFSWQELLEAGYPLSEVKPLRVLGLGASGAAATAAAAGGGGRSVGFELTVNELRKAGYSIEECLRAGFDAKSLRSGGFDELELVRCGLLTESQLKRAGCDVQRIALRSLYESTDGDHWKRNTNWCSQKPLSEWHGLHLNGAGQIIRIDLRSNNLTGSLPDAICLLSQLEYLDIYNNHLSGPIPSTYSQLSNLKDIWLASNDFGESLRIIHVQNILPNCRIRM